MHSTANPKLIDDPHDILMVASDEALMVPTDEELAELARSMRHPAAERAAGLAVDSIVPPVDTTFRPAAVGDVGLKTMGERTARAVAVALLVAACTGGAAIAWQTYGASARQVIARWVPQHLVAAVLQQQETAPAAQPEPSASEATAVDAAAMQPAIPAQPAPERIALAAVEPSPESAPSLGAITNDLANARQEIAQLKANIEQIRASQEQLARDVTRTSTSNPSTQKPSAPKPSVARPAENKASEQNPRPKSPARPWHAAAPQARQRMPPASQQAAAYPAPPTAYPALPAPAVTYAPRPAESPQPVPAETLADPELASVPRPPMPLR